MSDQQQDTTTQSVIYELIHGLGNRFMGSLMNTNVAMALAVYATPHVTNLANKAVLDAQKAIYILQVYFFVNRETIYYASEDQECIAVLDPGYVLNLNIGSVNQELTDAYRKSLSPVVSERLIIFNMIDTNVCVVVPFLRKPLTGDLGKNVNLNGFTLLVRLNSCIVKDLARDITYTFYYGTTGLNKITYVDSKNGWNLSFFLDSPPIIQKI